MRGIPLMTEKRGEKIEWLLRRTQNNQSQGRTEMLQMVVPSSDMDCIDVAQRNIVSRDDTALSLMQRECYQYLIVSSSEGTVYIPSLCQ